MRGATEALRRIGDEVKRAYRNLPAETVVGRLLSLTSFRADALHLFEEHIEELECKKQVEFTDLTNLTAQFETAVEECSLLPHR
jgi:hypothetical protein